MSANNNLPISGHSRNGKTTQEAVTEGPEAGVCVGATIGLLVAAVVAVGEVSTEAVADALAVGIAAADWIAGFMASPQALKNNSVEKLKGRKTP